MFCIVDYVVVGSDSGRITILEYNQAKNQFERIHMETFGKSGCRRIVPGQYLAIDPKGRAVMIGKYISNTVYLCAVAMCCSSYTLGWLMQCLFLVFYPSDFNSI